jgi:hypothetical protein
MSSTSSTPSSFAATFTLHSSDNSVVCNFSYPQWPSSVESTLTIIANEQIAKDRPINISLPPSFYQTMREMIREPLPTFQPLLRPQVFAPPIPNDNNNNNNNNNINHSLMQPLASFYQPSLFPDADHQSILNGFKKSREEIFGSNPKNVSNMDEVLKAAQKATTVGFQADPLSAEETFSIQNATQAKDK